MYFLIDFENVKSDGLRGVDYLEESDYLTIFFSNAARSCENRYLDADCRPKRTFVPYLADT